MDEKAWRSRGYLPHYNEADTLQFITYRLFDSVPAEVIAAWKEELRITGRESGLDPKRIALEQRIAAYEDAGYGSCFLAEDRIAAIVENNLHHFDGSRYFLLAWCVMPNHVHVLIETVSGHSLEGVLHSWKSFTAKKANKVLARRGSFWMKEYYDRYMRDPRHLENTIEYIEENPVTAGLVRNAVDWPWSSARIRLWGEE